MMRMATNCCVPQCKTYFGEKVSFHLFPKTDKTLRSQWINQLKIEKEVSPFMRVCGKHFRDEDYFFNRRVPCKVHRLKKNSVPSVNLPKDFQERHRNDAVTQAKSRRRETKKKMVSFNMTQYEDRRNHNIEYSCKSCQWSSDFLFVIRNHMRIHWLRSYNFNCTSSTPEHYYCNECTYITNEYTELKRHIEKDHNKNEASRQCSRSFCDCKEQRTPRVVCYWDHDYTNKLLTCIKCKWMTNNIRNAVKHISTKHIFRRDTDSIECDQCSHESQHIDLSMAQKLLKKRVSNEHVTEMQFEWFVCNYCESRFRTACCLSTHMRRLHLCEERELYKCYRCSYSTKYRACLKSHFLHMHAKIEDIKQQKYNHCEFKTKLALLRSDRLHGDTI